MKPVIAATFALTALLPSAFLVDGGVSINRT